MRHDPPDRGRFLFATKQGDSQPTGWSINGNVTERTQPVDPETQETTPATETTDATTGDTSAQTTGDATGTNGGNDGRTFTQADVDRIIADRLKQAEAKAAKAQQKAEAEAEAKRLEEQQEYQQLAQKRAEELEALKPTAEKAERYESALTAHLETQRTGLPDYIIEILDTMDPVAQLEYIAKHHDKLKPAETPKNGIPPTPTGGSGAADDERSRKAQEAMAASYRRAF